MREVIVSPAVAGQLSDIKNYLKNELKLSQDAASAYNGRLWKFIDSLVTEVDYLRCAVSNGGGSWVTGVRYSRKTGCWPTRSLSKVLSSMI